MRYDDSELIELIFLNLPNYVFCKDSQGVFKSCNHNFAMLVGLDSPTKIIGQTDDTLPLAKNLTSPTKDLQFIDAGKPLSIEKIDVDIQGERRHFLIEKKFIFDQNKQITYIIGSLSDITYQEKLNASLEQAVHIQKSYVADINKSITGQAHRDMSVAEYTDEIRLYLENIIAAMPGNEPSHGTLGN